MKVEKKTVELELDVSARLDGALLVVHAYAETATGDWVESGFPLFELLLEHLRDSEAKPDESRRIGIELRSLGQRFIDHALDLTGPTPMPVKRFCAEIARQKMLESYQANPSAESLSAYQQADQYCMSLRSNKEAA